MTLLAQAATELSDDAKTVAWVCFILGIVLLAVGTFYGAYLTLVIEPREQKRKEQLEREAKEKVDEAALAAGDSAEAQQTAAEAKSKIEQLASLIGALPEKLRFPALLILVGALLISVATVQFGGTSLL